MNCSVASAAKRLEIFQRIVPLLFWCSHAKPVNVVNVQVILAAAALAGVVVTLQGSYAISAETIVVFGLLAILLDFVRVLGRPLSYASDVSIILARFAFPLRPSRVFKGRFAIFAGKKVAFARRTNNISLGSAILSAFDAMVFFLAIFTRFLGRAFWCILTTTHGAGFWGKVMGFHMSHSEMMPNKYSGGAV
jgi:hypothetical protein